MKRIKIKEMNFKKEKDQLISNVQMLANELDDLNENNSQLYNKIQKDKNLKKLYELYTTKKTIKNRKSII